MNEPILARDLCEGAYVTTDNGYCYEIRAINQTICSVVAYRLDTGKLPYELPIGSLRFMPIDADWLTKLGFVDITQSEDKIFGFQWNKEFDVYDFQVVLYENEPHWQLMDAAHYYTQLCGVHHLQALIWQLERIWLSLKKEVVPC